MRLREDRRARIRWTRVGGSLVVFLVAVSLLTMALTGPAVATRGRAEGIAAHAVALLVRRGA